MAGLEVFVHQDPHQASGWDSPSVASHDESAEAIYVASSQSDAVAINHFQYPSLGSTSWQLSGSTSLSASAIVSENPPSGIVFEGQLQVAEYVKGFEFGTLSVEDEDVGELYDFQVSDPRFQVIDGRLRLKPDQWLAPSDGPSVSVTVTAVSQSNGDRVQTTLGIEVILDLLHGRIDIGHLMSTMTTYSLQSTF